MEPKKLYQKKNILVAYDKDAKDHYFLDIELNTLQRDKKDYENLSIVKMLDGVVLTISGEVRYKGHFRTGWQIIDELEYLLKADNVRWDVPKDKVARLVEIWKTYHLNDLHAGTKKQEEFIKKMLPNYEYSNACVILKEAGIYEDRGYKYGHGWLYAPIPDDIIEFVREF